MRIGDLHREALEEPFVHSIDEVLLLARDEACQTVVVGHRAHTWFRGLGGGHLAEQLVRTAKGLAVWVID